MNDISHTLNLDNFRDMLQICPRLPGQKFKDPPFEEEILSFIRDLGHTGEIKVLTDVNVNHMHQPWRSFAAIINRRLSGKTNGLDRLRLSRAQIIWGMYHKKNVDYVYLLWEDLVYQVENKNSKKNNDMCYPRFTKVIINYFMTKDQLISRRNKMFWHTVRDDPMFNIIRVISRHQDTQIYGAILPDELTNHDMKDSEAYKLYYTVVSRAESLKEKYKKKADELVTPSKKKTAPASKGSRIKSSAKIAKSDKKKQPATKTKTKGLTVLSEVALSEAEQLKLATKISKIQFHSSHASGSGDGVNTPSKVPDEQQQNISGTNEGAGDGPEVPDVPRIEENESDNDDDNLTHPNLSTFKADDEEEEEEKPNDKELYSDQRVSTPPDYELTKEEEEENKEGDDKDMEANKETEDAHVTLTDVPPVVQQQSSSISSDLVSKFINLTLDIAVSLIPAIVDKYLASKLKDVVDVAIQLQSNKLREEAQAENEEFLKQIDSNMKAIIKEQIKAQVSKIMPKVEKYVTESLGAEILRGRDDQDKDEDPSAGSNRGSKRRRSGKETESSKEPTHKESKSTSSSKGASRSHLKSLGKSAQVEEHVIVFDHFINNDLEYLKGWSLSQRYTTLITKTKAADYGHVNGLKTRFLEEYRVQKKLFMTSMLTGERITRGLKCQKFYGYAANMDTSKYVYSRHKIITVTSLKIMQFFGYSHLEEIIVRRQDDQLYKFREGDFKRLLRQDTEDMLLLIFQERVEDLQLGVESYQKINLLMPDSYHSDLRKMTPYTAYPDIQGIFYQDDMDRNCLMCTEELHKFSDGALNYVRTSLNDIAKGIQMEYLPKRKWSKQDKQRARVKINAIDKKLKDRRLMRSLDKFVGGRPYRGELRMLERTI
ncbi:hypothetical protein Tco_0869206 [Tanacetum coccineum]